MTMQDLHWSTIHASALKQARAPMQWVSATPRPRGALRYRCPISGSFVLVTDEPTLGRLAGGRARLRCADCREQHLITVAADDPGEIVAFPAKP